VRTAALDAARAFFRAEGFVEVETPALQASPGLEPHLQAFATEIVAPDRASKRRLFLHTSPEFAMKKLLVAGEPWIFQICRTYRNAERAPTHHPEFTMIEWYRAGTGYETIMADCEGLLRAVARAAGKKMLVWNGIESDPFAPWQHLSVADAFRAHAGLDLHDCVGGDPRAPDARRFRGRAAAIGIAVTPEDSWDDVFFRVFLERIEPKLGHPAPTLLRDYPISMAALARAKPGDPRLAERVELYVAGLELANGFGELTDAVQQRTRFERDMDLKSRLYGERYPIDEDFLAALAHGMPASAGIALGFDRLVMLASGAARIEDVLWAPVAEGEVP
ncbi:MAG: EF-P lysine aminoacylase GenX, partial [Alphaproteobacteria bacterium]|nr:EF-P lysine aminoacylase GenX [Alphaproteobacteria bacterium]